MLRRLPTAFNRASARESARRSLHRYWPLLVLCLVHQLAVWISGNHSFVIPEDWWQLLSRDALLEEPLTSLALLHAQPPALNALYAIALHLSKWSAISPAHIGSLLFALITFATLWALYDFALALSQSRAVSTLSTALIVINPALQLHQQLFFYTPIEALLLTIAAGQLARWTKDFRLLHFVLAMIALAFLVLSRSLWHPVFFILLATALLIAAKRFAQINPTILTRAGVASLLIFLTLLAPWMIKNKILFNTFGFTSWTGMNLDGKRLRAFMSDPEKGEPLTDAELTDYYSPRQLEILRAHPATGQLRKAPDIAASLNPNMNHYYVPPLSRLDVEERLSAWKRNPSIISQRARLHLLSLDFPPYCDPYAADPQTGHYELAGRYAHYHDLVYYGGWFKRLVPISILGVERRLSLWFLVLLPLFLVLLTRTISIAKSPTLRIGALYILIVTLWFLAIAIFIDGRESMRMKWSIEPVCTVAAVCLLHAARRRITRTEPS